MQGSRNVRWLVIALLLFPTLPSWGQEMRSRAAYFELLGNGGLYSINYEVSPARRTRLRVGFAHWEAEDLFSDNKVRLVTFPVVATYLAGRGNHWFESGAGVLAGHKREAVASGTFLSLTGVIGYRYQRPEGGFLFRAGLTPFVGLTGGETAYPDEAGTASIGVSFGYAWPGR